MEAILLAAGKGTRMRGLCARRPKPMLPLANRPLLAVTVEHLAAAGVERVFVVVGHFADQIEAHFASHPPSIPVEFIYQERPTGTGSAALLGQGRMKDAPFLLAFGDIVTSGPNYSGIVRCFRQTDCSLALSTRYVPDPYRGAAVYVDDEGRVTRIIEKPPKGQSTTHFDSAGLFCFRPEIWQRLERLLPSPRGEYELTDAIAATLADGERIQAFEMTGYWLNLTGPEEYIEANVRRLEDVNLNNAPPFSIVDGTAQLEDCRIGPNVCIGPNCRIREGAVLENAVLLEGAVVGPHATVRNAVLGSHSRVAARARLEGAPERVAVALDVLQEESASRSGG